MNRTILGLITSKTFSDQVFSFDLFTFSTVLPLNHFESNFYFFDFIRVVVILNLKFLSILFCCEIIRLGSPKPGPE